MTATNTCRRNILGVAVDPLRMRDVLDRCESAVVNQNPIIIGVVNAAKIVAMRKDQTLFEAIAGTDMVLADGMSVVWAGRILGQPIPERVAGIDLFEQLLSVADRLHARVALLGARQEVLDELVRRITVRFPHVTICAAVNGYYSEAQLPGIVAQIRASRPDMLFVAMSPPKKELFLARWAPHLGVSVCHGVGGAFDVLAGRTARAPVWMQQGGLEWLHRLAQEPRRLTRRYLTTNATFLFLLLCEIGRRRCGRLLSRFYAKAATGDRTNTAQKCQ